jgi:hypothetical protein
MTKIPVGKTIARAYAFGFRDFLRILGVMWLPLAIMWIPGIFLQRRAMALQAQAAAGNLSAFRDLWPILLPLYLVIFLFLFMQVIGIAKLALGIKKGPSWFYFSLGRPVWRLIGSFLLLIVAMIIGWLAVLLGGVVMGFLASLLNKAVGSSLFSGIVGVVAVVAMIALWCGYVYAVVRLTFLLVPVIAAEEEGFALARSWTLGVGNFWRMFVVLLAVMGPFLVLEMALLFGVLFRGVPFPPSHASTEQAAAFQAAVNARTLEMVGTLSHYWYVAYPVSIIVLVLFYGIYIGAPSFAYRALSDDEASVPVTAD